MNFTYDEELIDARDLARSIFTRESTLERIREVDDSGDGFDLRLWGELAKAGLLGVALPESVDGAGLGFGGLCSVLIEQGAHLAQVPVWTTVVAAMTLLEFGPADLAAQIVPTVVDGRTRITVAVEEFGSYDCSTPRCSARRESDSWKLSGAKAVVPSFKGADLVMVSAEMGSGPGLFLIEADTAGVRWEAVDTTGRDGSGNLLLENATAVLVGEGRSGVLGWALERARVAVAALQLGVAERSLELSAKYVTSREQFGRPLGTFQAVQHQLADSYMGIDAMRVCLWRAVEAIDSDERDETASRIAKWWSDEQGAKVVDTTVHVHGGVGVDVDSPIHRYYLWGHQLARTLGGARSELSGLGAALTAKSTSVG
ncbi:acyl-CoA dehydrogenase [Rhodococcus sp. OK519]|nr:acyl-CoA dehydrogenase [Rhodococcus sp. OK519]